MIMEKKATNKLINDNNRNKIKTKIVKMRKRKS